ncbi:MAG: hypothetical protein U0W65_04910 [Bacteroidia bacterium]
MKILLIFILILLNVGSSFSQINNPPNSVCIYFNKGGLTFNHTPKQLDSLVVLLDSFILKYQVIKVIPISLSNEIVKDKFIDSKRAQIAIEFYKKHSKLDDRGKFYIRFFEHKKMNERQMKHHDEEVNYKCFVSFEPMFIESNINNIKTDTSKIENDEEMWFIKD